jgi:hypothetical protein
LFKKESTSIILGGSSNLRNNREQIGERSAETLDLLIDMISYSVITEGASLALF